MGNCLALRKYPDFSHIVESINSKYHMLHQEPVSMLMALEVLQNVSGWWILDAATLVISKFGHLFPLNAGYLYV